MDYNLLPAKRRPWTMSFFVKRSVTLETSQQMDIEVNGDRNQWFCNGLFTLRATDCDNERQRPENATDSKQYGVEKEFG